MYGPDDASAVASMPSTNAVVTALQNGGYFAQADLDTGVSPTVASPDYFNSILAELINVLMAAGITPSKATHDQVATAIQTLIAQEAARAEAAEANLQTELNTEANSRASEDAILQNNITAEATARASEDSTLQTNITNEANTRANADTTLQNNITAEANTRSTADTTLQTNITAEVNRATGKENQIIAQLSTAITDCGISYNIADANQIAEMVSVVGFGRTQILSGSSNFTVPAGVWRLRVIITGGGGGGANCDSNGTSSSSQSGGGGGAGATEIDSVAVSPGQVIAYSVGAGGGPQAAGAATTFGSLTAQPGAGAYFESATVSSGGAGGQGTFCGGDGSDGQCGSLVFAGNGGASFWGGGARAGNPQGGGGISGVNARAPGSGGGGVYCNGNSNGTFYGGSGANGTIVLFY